MRKMDQQQAMSDARITIVTPASHRKGKREEREWGSTCVEAGHAGTQEKQGTVVGDCSTLHEVSFCPTVWACWQMVTQAFILRCEWPSSQ